jgi:hypothetical protein
MTQYMVVGILKNYGAAESAVADLEHAGIVGNQVEVITDIDEDERTANTPGERSTVPHESSHGRLAKLFGATNEDVRDESGQMPDYIFRQEFYANHVKAGGAVMVVRTSTEQSANQAAGILETHGARSLGEKHKPVVRKIS